MPYVTYNSTRVFAPCILPFAPTTIYLFVYLYDAREICFLACDVAGSLFVKFSGDNTNVIWFDATCCIQEDTCIRTTFCWCCTHYGSLLVLVMCVTVHDMWHQILSVCIIIYDVCDYICGIQFHPFALSYIICVTIYVASNSFLLHSQVWFVLLYTTCGIKFYSFALLYMSYVVYRNTHVHPPYMLPLPQWLVICWSFVLLYTKTKKIHMHSHHICWHCAYYGVAMTRRLLKIIGLFCKRALSKRLYSAKETYDFKEPTNRSHPRLVISGYLCYCTRHVASNYVILYYYICCFYMYKVIWFDTTCRRYTLLEIIRLFCRI